jgi:hypothetical protein
MISIVNKLKLIFGPTIILLLLIYTEPSLAYPDFISYGYSSCITCHYNGHGGGALNDYGRALYASEITSRNFFPKTMDEEEIAAKSGFLGTKALPWWFRPGLKYRGLWLKTDPGSASTIERFINMQTDFNLAVFADKKQSFTLVTTYSYAGKEPYYSKTNTWFLKEYYVRWKKSNNLWFYFGQLDKVFGIRNVDHTAVSRRSITLGQYDQSQGIVGHFTYPDWDFAINAFIGNAAQDTIEKQKGFSASGEYQVIEKFKIGASVLSSQSEITKWNLASISGRLGLTKGSALMMEAGLKEKTNKSSGAESELGTYGILESMVYLSRGYNLLSVIEHSKANIKRGTGESMRWSIGGLLFPFPRSEFRLMAVNAKSYAEESGTPDSWALQGQLHISY